MPSQHLSLAMKLTMLLVIVATPNTNRGIFLVTQWSKLNVHLLDNWNYRLLMQYLHECLTFFLYWIQASTCIVGYFYSIYMEILIIVWS